MGTFSRRVFLGTAGLTGSIVPATAAVAGFEEAPRRRRARKTTTSGFRRDVAELVAKTPLVDTHEHLWEESFRLANTQGGPCPPSDFGMLMCHYTDSDLAVSGMSGDDYKKLTSAGLAPRDKWKLVAPYYARCRHTGYQLCIRESVKALYGEEDLREDNCETISEKLLAQVQPGFYRRILKDVANIDYCQVNALDTPVFRKTAQPDLLCQDISTVSLSTTYLDVPGISQRAGISVSELKQWHDVLDWCFATYGPIAVATKNQSAYSRRLDYVQVSEAEAAPIFARYVKDKDSISPAELKTIQDHLFHYCLDKAAEFNLPAKLHTGYYAGYGGMPLERLRQNAGDLCPVVQAHPKTNFVLMHIDYPYQDEVIALAKGYRNVYVDMCWAWIINPQACVRFVKEFLMAAPACKLFTFGGDYLPVELVPGHAAVARRGLSQALAELVEEGWLTESDLPGVAERIMRGNAHELYDYERVQRNWKA